MAESDKTRVETVTENIEKLELQRGKEAWQEIYAQCLKDISVSLAMLVDGGSGD